MYMHIDEAGKQSLPSRFHYVRLDGRGFRGGAVVYLLDSSVLDEHAAGFDHGTWSDKHAGIANQKRPAAALGPVENDLLFDAIAAVSLISSEHQKWREHGQDP